MRVGIGWASGHGIVAPRVPWVVGSLLCATWAAATDAEPERIIFVQVPVQSAARPETGDREALLADGPPLGSRIVLYDHGSLDGSVKVLTPEFAAAGKPDVSFDGKRILFIGRRDRNDPSQIWEMDADGGSLRRVTDESGGFTAAIYLSTMYTLDAEEPAYQIGFCRTISGGLGDSLFTCRMDGTRIRQITFDPNGVSDPFLLSDGRLLYTRWRRTSNRAGSTSDRATPPLIPPWEGGGVITLALAGRLTQTPLNPPLGRGEAGPALALGGRVTTLALGVLLQAATVRAVESPEPASRNTDLLTVYPDGMDVFVFAAADEPPAIRSMPCETPDGLVVYVESPVGSADRDSADRGGALVAVSRARSLHTRRVLVDDPNGLYHSPSAMDDGRLLVSYCPKSGGSYGVYVFDPASGTRVARVFDDPQWHEVDALVLGPRRVPAGRSSAIREGVGYGFLYCMDAYLSDRPEVGAMEAGQIKRLRVLRLHVQSPLPLGGEDRVRGEHSNTDVGPSPLPLSLEGRGVLASAPNSSLSQAGDSRNEPAGTQTHLGVQVAAEEVLGEVPVESDGSFSVQVPAQVPLRLQTLDGAGHVLQDMKSWIWVMPKEARGCIGCHEDRELTPPNRQTQALRNLPQPLGIEDPVNTGHAAEVLDERRPGE